MTDFKLDTSGGVFAIGTPLFNPTTQNALVIWPDLSPFAQGYVEAALADLHRRLFSSGGYTEADFVGYRHLAPETLARIIEDCDWVVQRGDMGAMYHGGGFWIDRQSGHWERFPPVTFSLGDDGLIHLKEPT